MNDTKAMTSKALAATQVISVNPSEKTLGEKLFNADRLADITRCIVAPGESIGFSWAKFVNFFFGINKKVGAQLSAKLLLLRVIVGAAMISSVLVPMHPDAVMAFEFEMVEIPVLIFGSTLVLGLFTRLTSAVAAAWFGYVTYITFTIGTFNMGEIALILAGVNFAVLGPGRYGVDQLMRVGLKALSRKLQESRTPGKSATLDYRAYTSVDRRVV